MGEGRQLRAQALASPGTRLSGQGVWTLQDKPARSGQALPDWGRSYYKPVAVLMICMRLRSPLFGTAPCEKVAERTGIKHRRPPLPAMRNPVMGEMAALAERSQVSGSVVAGVLVEMRGGKDDIGRRQGQGCKAREGQLQSNEPGMGRQCPRTTATVVTPVSAGVVPPQPVGSNHHPFPMRSPATLAAAAGAIEADHLA